MFHELEAQFRDWSESQVRPGPCLSLLFFISYFLISFGADRACRHIWTNGVSVWNGLKLNAFPWQEKSLHRCLFTSDLFPNKKGWSSLFVSSAFSTKKMNFSKVSSVLLSFFHRSSWDSMGKNASLRFGGSRKVGEVSLPSDKWIIFKTVVFRE